MEDFKRHDGQAFALARLSERQRDCLALVADGHTSKEIARRLSLSPSTVDNHIRAALERLGMPDRASAARLLLASQQDTPAGPSAPRSLLALPPLGGVTNDLSIRRRVYHIVQIALLGIMGMTAAVITIAGLVNLFSR